jgi:hypothetical protein
LTTFPVIASGAKQSRDRDLHLFVLRPPFTSP